MAETVDSRIVVSTDGSSVSLGEVRRQEDDRILLRFRTGLDTFEDKWFATDTGEAEDGTALRLADSSYLTSVTDRVVIDGVETSQATQDDRIDALEGELFEMRAEMDFFRLLMG